MYAHSAFAVAHIRQQMTGSTALFEVYNWTVQNQCWQYFTTFAEEL